MIESVSLSCDICTTNPHVYQGVDQSAAGAMTSISHMSHQHYMSLMLEAIHVPYHVHQSALQHNMATQHVAKCMVSGEHCIWIKGFVAGSSLCMVQPNADMKQKGMC